jgi:hypothetical protein
VVGKVLPVETQIGQLRHFLPLVENVIRQTKERVVKGNSHMEDKVLSLFEPHTEIPRKGKAHKPNEFGRLVRIDEVENGIVSGYQVLVGNPADTTSRAQRTASSCLQRWSCLTLDSHIYSRTYADDFHDYSLVVFLLHNLMSRYLSGRVNVAAGRS